MIRGAFLLLWDLWPVWVSLVGLALVAGLLFTLVVPA